MGETAATVTTDRYSNRRTGVDRRRHSLRTLTYCGLQGRGRRLTARRHDHSYYLDHYDPALVYSGIALLLMSALDAMFTLTLLQNGAYEANYLMAELITISDTLFVSAKILVTMFGVLFLLIHSHFRLLGIGNGGQALQWLLVPYALLIIWEISMMGVLL